MKNVTILFGALLLTASGAALAQQEAPSFNDVDANGDGSISSSELRNADNVDVSMDDADTDGNGELSRTEYMSATMSDSSGSDSSGGGLSGSDSSRSDSSGGGLSGSDSSGSDSGI